MKRFTYRRGLKLGLSGLAVFAACITTTTSLTANVTGVPVNFSGTTTINTVTAVDLTTQSAYTNNKSKIAGCHLKSVVLTIPQGGVHMANNTPAINSGSVALRPDGVNDASQDVPAGTLSSAIPITVGSTLTINVGTNTAVDTFLKNATTGSGKFQVVINGAVQPASSPPTVGDFALDVQINLALDVNII
jgi:hypothetical protein